MTKEQALKIAKPILFNTDMVRAIIDRRKTVTRRVLKPKYTNTQIIIKNGRAFETVGTLATTTEIKLPYQVGDILYVRETWLKCGEEYWYKASRQDINDNIWHPSIHMPKEAARIFLRVTNVHVEQLQDIITGDYKTPLNINREGLLSPCGRCTHHNGDCEDFIAQNACRLVDEFIKLWNSTAKEEDLYRYGWAANPPVLAVTFKGVEVSE